MQYRERTWLERDAEYEAEFSWGEDLKMIFAPVLIVLSLVGSICLAAYGLLQIV